MNVYDLIFRKREGETLAREEIEYIVSGFISGEIPPYQMSAFLMAVFFKGMDAGELAELTRVMCESGEQIDLGDLSGISADKHSTGGVGDGVSLTLAPLAASLGAVVPMMSGRGLGHTGGTLDKLESIPGYNVNLSQKEFFSQLGKIGVAIIGQTENIAPADKKMYALRDVTATVDSIPLIAASIMSKKLAEGAGSLVFDVKTGTGAFMRDISAARSLALSMIETGRARGRRTAAVISDMSRPLGRAVGNASEISQAVELMSGGGPDDIKKLTIELTAMMLVLAGLAENSEVAKDKASANLSNGKALEKFARMVSMQGGDPRVAEAPERVLAQPENTLEVRAPMSGYISGMDTRLIGMCAVRLGAGRRSVGEPIDFSAGIEILKKTGDGFDRGEALALLHSTRVKDLGAAEREYIAALSFSETAVPAPELIYEVLQ